MTLSWFVATVLTSLAGYVSKDGEDHTKGCDKCESRAGFVPTLRDRKTCSQCVRREVAIRSQEFFLVSDAVNNGKTPWSQRIRCIFKGMKDRDDEVFSVEGLPIFSPDWDLSKTSVYKLVIANWAAIVAESPDLEGFPFEEETFNLNVFWNLGQDQTGSSNLKVVQTFLKEGISQAIEDQDTKKQVELQAAMNQTQGMFGMNDVLNVRKLRLKPGFVPPSHPYFDVWFSKWFCCSKTSSDIIYTFDEGQCDLHRLRGDDDDDECATTVADYCPVWYGHAFESVRNLVDTGVPRLVRGSGVVYIGGWESWKRARWSDPFNARVKQVGLLVSSEFLMLSSDVQAALMSKYRNDPKKIPTELLGRLRGKSNQESFDIIYAIKSKKENAKDDIFDQVWKFRHPKKEGPVTISTINDELEWEEQSKKQRKKKNPKPTAEKKKDAPFKGKGGNPQGKQGPKAKKPQAKSNPYTQNAFRGTKGFTLYEQGETVDEVNKRYNADRKKMPKAPNRDQFETYKKGSNTYQPRGPGENVRRSWAQVAGQNLSPAQRIKRAFGLETLEECDAAFRKRVKGEGRLNLAQAAKFWNNGKFNSQGMTQQDIARNVYLN